MEECSFVFLLHCSPSFLCPFCVPYEDRKSSLRVWLKDSTIKGLSALGQMQLFEDTVRMHPSHSAESRYLFLGSQCLPLGNSAGSSSSGSKLLGTKGT